MVSSTPLAQGAAPEVDAIARFKNGLMSKPYKLNYCKKESSCSLLSLKGLPAWKFVNEKTPEWISYYNKKK